MGAQVVVGTIVDPLELLPAEGELVLDVVGVVGVVRELLTRVLNQLEPVGPDAQRLHPFQSHVLPIVEPLLVRARLDEELHLHLLELTGSKDEVAGRYLVTERLSDLCDPEGDPLSRGVQHVEKVHVDALRRLGTQVDLRRRLLLYRPHKRAEHQVEHAWRCELVLHAAAGTLVLHLVRSEATVAVLALDQRIGEALHVAARHPDLGVHEDAGIEPLDVGPRGHHLLPPAVLDVPLQFDAQRAVIPDRAEAAIHLGGLIDEPPPLTERHKLFH